MIVLDLFDSRETSERHLGQEVYDNTKEDTPDERQERLGEAVPVAVNPARSPR
eukprot:CAMPEP_0114514484 /NCGR_PEP_ID=MMETSP0109-20121206/16180_1 /TAXON_ID=29199 /ORGANISM="Chlorarachnion reptans, Strain CCCM449" /LENGTH=52 /DNA_ID=CAMNT_0001694531 /DNA_START=793 /DNA_END=948 /DNA_ORIENTATION=-